MVQHLTTKQAHVHIMYRNCFASEGALKMQSILLMRMSLF